jgi:hypothetical protein
MYAIYSYTKGYFKGYELRNNVMTAQWGTGEYDFHLAVFIDFKATVEEATKLSAVAYPINQLPM